MRVGKTYDQIMRVVADAKKQGWQKPIWVSSESMKKRMEEIAEMMGTKIEVVASKRLEGTK